MFRECLRGYHKDEATTAKEDCLFSGEDFHALFEDRMSELYQLAVLLTANAELAETCLVSAFEGCVNGRAVLRERADHWARHIITKSAIRLVSEAQSRCPEFPSSGCKALSAHGERTALRNVVSLPPLERFAFVLTVLERYSDKETEVLLQIPAQDIREARIRAFQWISQIHLSPALPDTV